MRKLKAALLGTGIRGKVYCDYALKEPEELEIVAVIDVNAFRLNEAGDRYGVREDMRFASLDEFLEKKVACDFVVNATMDEIHYETSQKIVKAGYNIILEKPITGKEEELLALEEAVKEKGVKMLVCHVLRYTPYYRAIKEVLASGKLGKVVNMQLNEHVAYGHFVNAFVRGKWRNEKLSGSGLILAKCCHDTDLICWLNNETAPARVSSFGSKSYFTEKNAPEGATQYCYQCPNRETCPFDAEKFEIGRDFIPFYTWAELNKPLKEITIEEKREFLKHSSFGECVYKVDMDLVDRQCVSIEFENGSLATLNLVGGATAEGRHIHIVCEYGEIIGYVNQNKFTLRTFDKEQLRCVEETVDCAAIKQAGNGNKFVSGHYGGDYYMMHDAIRYFNGDVESVSVTKVEDSVNGHLICYAAEKSRKENRTVNIQERKF